VKVEEMRHTALATALRFLFLAAKIWRHAGRVGVSYSDDHCEEKDILERLMGRLRAIVATPSEFAPVMATALRC